MQEIALVNVTLADVKTEELSDEMKKLTAEEREKLIGQKKAEREQLNKQLAEISKKRNDYIAAESAKNKKAGAKSFDAKVSEAIAAQLAKISSK